MYHNETEYGLGAMKVLTVANRKGGAGKSTCAAHLALESIRDGIKTIIVDLDPQKTLEGWWNRRDSDDLPLIDLPEKKTEEVLKNISSKGFELCIVDTPGDASQNSRLGISLADLVLIPSKPTAPDLSAIGRTISMVEEQDKKYVFVLTQGIVRSKATFQASSVLSSFGPVAPAVISNRTSYASAMGMGNSACEIDKAAEEESRQVWKFIKDRLFESKQNKKSKFVA
ncbi:ParA family protein [Candidatus Bealeia paramacronuclearis]|uniref:AAA family ATPase n=1 Tax=Candidatus Bealeia paramacronuclearis TaxID=1921001 RepID=UPI002C8A0C8D|nr:ParA family protein [Candidatus Bealeia paramacronuclearis]